ncbi:MAG: hypothetical protein VB049_03180 [Candidatus Pelethousia sp.]|nr:hypothetical protein [Candidatus Pelethousia sp.]
MAAADFYWTLAAKAGGILSAKSGMVRGKDISCYCGYSRVSKQHMDLFLGGIYPIRNGAGSGGFLPCLFAALDTQKDSAR